MALLLTQMMAQTAVQVRIQVIDELGLLSQTALWMETRETPRHFSEMLVFCLERKRDEISQTLWHGSDDGPNRNGVLGDDFCSGAGCGCANISDKIADGIIDFMANG